MGAEGWGHNDKPAQRDSHNLKHIFRGLGIVSLKSMWRSSKPSHLGFQVGGKERTRNRSNWRTPAHFRNSEGEETASSLGAGAGSECGRGEDPQRPGWWLSPRPSMYRSPTLPHAWVVPQPRSPDSGVSVWGPHQAQCWRSRKKTQGESPILREESHLGSVQPPKAECGESQECLDQEPPIGAAPDPSFSVIFLAEEINTLLPFSTWAPTQPPNPAQRAPPLRSLPCPPLRVNCFTLVTPQMPCNPPTPATARTTLGYDRGHVSISPTRLQVPLEGGDYISMIFVHASLHVPAATDWVLNQ